MRRFGSEKMKQKGIKKQQEGQDDIDEAKAQSGRRNELEGQQKQLEAHTTDQKLDQKGKAQERKGLEQQQT